LYVHSNNPDICDNRKASCLVIHTNRYVKMEIFKGGTPQDGIFSVSYLYYRDFI